MGEVGAGIWAYMEVRSGGVKKSKGAVSSPGGWRFGVEVEEE
jgi:hypothetical protein